MAYTPPWLEYHDPPIQLHSGDWSNWLIRADIILDWWPHLRDMLLDRLIERYGLAGRHRIAIYGVPQGGTLWAGELASRLGYWHVSEPRLTDAYELWVVDDVVTTGGSLQEIEADAHFALIDRGENYVLRVAWRLPLPSQDLSELRKIRKIVKYPPPTSVVGG